MVKKWFDRSAARQPKLDWQQIVHPAASAGLPEQPDRPSEEDWLQAAVPQSVISDRETPFAADYAVCAAQSDGAAAPQVQHRQRNSWRWSLLWLTALGICGSVGSVALLWLTTLPPPPDCQNITPLTADVERLYCAEQAARSGEISKLVAGLHLVGQWTPDHPLYREAQGLMAGWSKTLISIARTAYNKGDIRKANEVIRQIPASSPAYGDAKKTVAQWQHQWQEGKKIYDAAQVALKQQKWSEASSQLSALSQVENNYWRRSQLINLTQQILAEKQAWQQLSQARQQGKISQPSSLGSAIEQAAQIDPKTYTGAIAKTDLARWSKTLTNIGLQRWKQNDRTGAILAVQQFPAEFKVAPQVKEMLRFGQAIDLASQARSNWQPAIPQVLGLLDAIAAAKQIPPGSPFHAEAQTAMQNWQKQLADLTQLQFASLTASVGQKAALQLAIQQAQAIGASHPRRVQAQTLVAHWHNEIERIEDHPYVDRARELAQPGTIASLQSAIDTARQVRLGRALRIEAQTDIAQWNNQIEVIEDRPILDQAKALAQQGRLSRAIGTAARIRSGRVLYSEARSAIWQWQGELMIAQDRAILDEARSLAAIDSLTLAIGKASQISPNSLLYGEAQSEMGQWQIRRQEIWDIWASEGLDSGSEGDSGGYAQSY